MHGENKDTGYGATDGLPYAQERLSEVIVPLHPV